MTQPDPWSRSLLDTPSPAPSEPTNEPHGFITCSNHHTFSLDLEGREDNAVVENNPFSIARVNAKTRERQAIEKPADFRPSIVTAEDAARSQAEQITSLTSGPRNKAPSSPWTIAQGCTDTHIDSQTVDLPEGTTTQINKRGGQSWTSATADLSAPPTLQKKAPPKPKSKPKPKAKPTAKRATTSDDKVHFGLLPTNLSNRFPIVAGLERQKLLPVKPKGPKQRAPKPLPALNPMRTPTPPPLKSDDIHDLVTGGLAAEETRKRAKDTLVASGFYRSGARPKTTSKQTTSNGTPAEDAFFHQHAVTSQTPSKAAPAFFHSQESPLTASGRSVLLAGFMYTPKKPGATDTAAEVGSSEKSPHTLPSPPPVSNSERYTRAHQPSSFSPASRSHSPLLLTPRPGPPSVDVSHLEAVAESGYSCTGHSLSSPMSLSSRHRGLPPSASHVETIVEKEPDHDGPIYLSQSIRRVSQHMDYPPSSPRSFPSPRRSQPYTASQLEEVMDGDDDCVEETTYIQPPMPNNRLPRYNAVLQFETILEEGYDSGDEPEPSPSRHGARLQAEYPAPRGLASRSRATPSQFRYSKIRGRSNSPDEVEQYAPSPRQPLLPQPNQRHFIAPSTIHNTQTHARTYPSPPRARASQTTTTNSYWTALALREPELEADPSPDGEWSTLPAKRRRLTIRPQASSSAPKSTSFRIPLHRLGRAAGGSAAPRQMATASKVTVWSPTALGPLDPHTQPSSQVHRQSQQYVPPAMRALHQAHGAQLGTQPMISTGLRTQPFAHARRTPVAEPEPEEDWTAAWSRSANIASRNL